MKNIYLDYGASTPVAEEVVETMSPFLREDFGNAGSIHYFGQRAKTAIDKSREIIAKELGAKFNEVIFTGSATEANNLAIRGVVRGSDFKKPRVIISTIEHESVLETCEALEPDGVEVIKIPVSKDGFVDTGKLKEEINEDTVLVSVIYVSSVIGTVQPIEEIGKLIADFKAENKSDYPIFHTDAAQALQFRELNTAKLGVDALTISGQKIYGPKGVGVLYLKEGLMKKMEPLITGGMQEFVFRAGTENVPAIAGLGKAVELISVGRVKRIERVKELRDYFWTELQKISGDLEVNGSMDNRSPNNLNVYFPGKDALEFLIALDQAGIAVSTGSACSIRATKPSYVVEALSISDDRADSSIRFTLGGPTTKEEIDEAIERVSKLI